MRIVCDKCGFATEKPAAALPRRRVKATCPKCQHVFPFDPSTANPSPPAGQAGFQPAPQDPGETRVSLQGRSDARANKLFFAFFLLLILVTVGVRLWAEDRAITTPFPTLLAASAEGVAVIGGRSVYLFSPDGTLLRSYPLPDTVQPTQLYWDQGALCLGDFESKTVLTFGPGSPGTRTFTGATINAHFKVARELATGRLFVSDGGSHRILVFDEAGHYLRSFGKEGKGAGAFRFPNGLAFDESGQLLITNTKRPAIELYTPDGRFQRTVVTPSGDSTYRYPTHVVVTPKCLLLLEKGGALEEGKVRIYDRSGTKLGELPLGELKSVGDLVADGERLYLTDRDNRQLLTFSLADLRPLGSFSREFAALCTQWNQDAAFFKKVSLGALVVLLVSCAPVIFFYVRIKKAESKDVSGVDLGRVAGRKSASGNGLAAADLILGTAVNARLRLISLVLLAAGVLSFLLIVLFVQLGLPPLYMLTAMSFGMIVFLVGVILLIRAGGVADWKRRQTEAVFKRIVFDGKLALRAGEQVERVALVQRSSSAQDVALLVFTGNRLLLYSLNWNKVARIEQFPYEAIIQVQPPSERLLQVVQSLQVTMSVGGESRQLKYYHPTADFLRQLSAEFSSRIGRVTGMAPANLCLSCLKPLQGDYCMTCATQLTPDRGAMWLSILFPGLGQLRNGELQKGLVFSVLTVGVLLLGYIGIRGWFYEGADLTLRNKFDIAVMIAMAPIWYVANVIDAYRSSIKGRKPE